MDNKNQPTFPFTPNNPWDDESANGFSGLTKREYFAAIAMQGLTSNPDWAKTMTPDDWGEYTDRLTKGSVELADALLKALEEI